MSELARFDYSVEDSLFFYSGHGTEKGDDSQKIAEKKVDSNQELLDFSANKIPLGLQKADSGGTRVNINTAGINILTTLPGIGVKTAEKIIEYRNQKGGFKTIYDLMKVKGIGDKKFGRLKNLIIVE